MPLAQGHPVQACFAKRHAESGCWLSLLPNCHRERSAAISFFNRGLKSRLLLRAAPRNDKSEPYVIDDTPIPHPHPSPTGRRDYFPSPKGRGCRVRIGETKYAGRQKLPRSPRRVMRRRPLHLRLAATHANWFHRWRLAMRPCSRFSATRPSLALTLRPLPAI